MTVKDFLKGVQRYNVLISRKKAQLEKLRALVEYGGAGMGDDPRVPSDPSRSRTDSLVRLASLSEELDSTIREMTDCRRKAMAMIDSLPDPHAVEILYMRYLDGSSWKDISDSMHMSLQWIFRLHGQAIDQLQARYASAV